MWKPILVFLLFITPIFVSARNWTLPSGKTFQEKISYHRTLSGVLVSVSEWIEIQGVIKKANASEDTLEETIKNYIRSISALYGIDAWFMEQLARCESNFVIDAKGDYIKNVPMALGIYQWWQKSWNHYNTIYKTQLDRKSWIDQVKMSVRVVDDYGTDDWKNCSRFIKEGSWDFLKKK